MLKDIIKNLIGKIKCILNGISNDGRVYIGRNVHIVNGKNLHLGSNVSIRPDCDIFADGCIKIGDNCDIGTRNRLNGDIYIEMTVTAPTCPIAGELPQQVADALTEVAGTGRIEVKIVWEPAWTPERMTDEAKEMLELI